MSVRVLTHLVWAMIALVAFAVGYLMREPVTQTAAPSKDGFLSSSAKPDSEERLAPSSNESDLAIKEASNAPFDTDAARVRTFQILSEPDYRSRLKDVLDLLPSITSENWRGVLDAFERQQRSEARTFGGGADFHLILERIGEVAGASALGNGVQRDDPDSHEFTAHILRGWAEKHSREAVQWFEDQNFGGELEKVVPDLLAGVARSNPVAALNLALNPRYQIYFDPKELINETVQRGGIRACDEVLAAMSPHLETLPAVKQRVFEAVSDKRAQMVAAGSDATANLDWLGQFFGSAFVNTQGAYDLIYQAGLRDPDKTITWLGDNQQKLTAEERRAAFNYVVSASAKREKEGVTVWLAAHPASPIHDELAASAMWLRALSPDQKQRLLETISDEEWRSRAESDLIRSSQRK